MVNYVDVLDKIELMSLTSKFENSGHILFSLANYVTSPVKTNVGLFQKWKCLKLRV